jgi:peroxiredoxin Q/BCP
MIKTGFIKHALLGGLLAAASLAAQAGEPPATGSAAPDFRLMDQGGEWHTLEDYRGKWVALYFYPKADTPGCTTEACNFRDNIFAFREMGAEIVGVSLDDVEDQKAFAEKYSLPFTLLADTEGETAEAYGVLRNFGVMKLASRQSFLIDPEGRIAKHYKKVDPDTHSTEVIADLKALMAGSAASGR